MSMLNFHVKSKCYMFNTSQKVESKFESCLSVLTLDFHVISKC